MIEDDILEPAEPIDDDELDLEGEKKKKDLIDDVESLDDLEEEEDAEEEEPFDDVNLI